MTLQEVPLTRLAAQRLLKIRESDLDHDLKTRAVVCLLDYVGALASGVTVPWAPALLKYAEQQSIPTPSQEHILAGKDKARSGFAHVVSMKEATSAEVAAFTNASIAHSVIRDDMHLQAGAHIGVMVIPAALALAERDNWDNDQLLKALVGGYEMAAFLGEAVRSSKSTNEHFRPSGIVGAFGAAGAVIAGGRQHDGSVSVDVAAHALGLAANMGSGLNEWAWAGGLEINTQMGSAARGGIMAMDLAVAGIESSATALEGRSGLFAAHSSKEADVDMAASNFRRLLSTSNLGLGINGVKFKPFAGCNFIQTSIATASLLGDTMRSSGAYVEDIASVRIITSTVAKRYPGCDNNGPFQKVQQSKMSLQYGVAAALLFQRLDEESYGQFDNERLNRLIQACVVESNVEFDAAWHQHAKQPCRIVVQMRDGTKYEKALDDVPWFDSDAVQSRCQIELSKTFDASIVYRIVKACGMLASEETVSPPADLCTLLAAA